VPCSSGNLSTDKAALKALATQHALAQHNPSIQEAAAQPQMLLDTHDCVFVCVLSLCCAVPCSSGNLSTDKAALKALATQHPLPSIILQYRKLQHNLSEMFRRINEANTAAATAAAGADTGAMSVGRATAADDAAAAAAGLVRVRGHWLQTCPASGRLSSEDPSLQTVAKDTQYDLYGVVGLAPAGSCPDSDAESDDGWDDAAEAAAGEGAAGAAAGGGGEQGPTGRPTAVANAAQQQQQQQQVKVCTASVRSAFVAPPGCVILAADYCQIEFRLMAHFSGDAAMLQAFSSGQDLFRALGATWLKKSSQQVSCRVLGGGWGHGAQGLVLQGLGRKVGCWQGYEGLQQWAWPFWAVGGDSGSRTAASR
jgi:hypothetical protein